MFKSNNFHVRETIIVQRSPGKSRMNDKIFAAYIYEPQLETNRSLYLNRQKGTRVCRIAVLRFVLWQSRLRYLAYYIVYRTVPELQSHMS